MADHAFDLWLRRSLHQMYDAVASEPLPAELLRVLGKPPTPGD